MISEIRRIVWAGALALCAMPAAAVECRDLDYDGQPYTICEVDAGSEDLRLFLKGQDDQILGSFRNVANDVAQDGFDLRFAMNAGMYHADRSPVGHYVEDGAEAQRLITSDGPGNFGLLPNGVFCIGDARADVVETKRFARTKPACRHATQSGPMLVIDGDLHPRFLKNSTSHYIRNGVGTSADGKRAVFAISNRPVTFHQFGRLYRDHLGLPNALYFDGKVSRLYAPDINRFDGGFPVGPMVGVLEPKASD